jgi:hypothetical protein
MRKNLCQNFIRLETLEGNDPAGLTTIQAYMSPYVGDIALLWWGVWMVTLAVVVYRFILRPLIFKNAQQ